MVLPIAGSDFVPAYVSEYFGSGVPSTVTACVSTLVRFADDVSLLPPEATMATTTASATTAANPPQSNHRLRRCRAATAADAFRRFPIAAARC